MLRDSPVMLNATLSILDLWHQIALLPFRRRRRTGRSTESAELVRRTDDYNDAAERYFASIEDPSYLLRKPFADAELLPKYLIDVGVLIGALRVMPGDVVLEIGAGSCWLSHFLNRLGCHTIAVDVSRTALDLGRQLFEADAYTDWKLEPRFLAYDGHRLPCDDASCDYVVLHDAFHHIPNQRELLTEMHRVLRPDGIVGMSEPGQGHADTEYSLQEMRKGVLENELVVEDLAALAQDCGFARVTVVPSATPAGFEIPADELGAFMGGKGFAAYWKAYSSALEGHHHILCYKGATTRTTRRPGRLFAGIKVASGSDVHVQAGHQATLTLDVVNRGDTTWRGGYSSIPGWTRVGGHLHKRGGEEELIDFDWWRADFPSNIEPGQQIELAVTMPAITVRGEYVVLIDLVVEGLTWFAGHGSPHAVINLTVA
jgi:SAM-dependent methyltransferase